MCISNFQIACDNCGRWYHHVCVKIPALDEDYLCPLCTQTVQCNGGLTIVNSLTFDYLFPFSYSFIHYLVCLLGYLCVILFKSNTYMYSTSTVCFIVLDRSSKVLKSCWVMLFFYLINTVYFSYSKYSVSAISTKLHFCFFYN